MIKHVGRRSHSDYLINNPTTTDQNENILAVSLTRGARMKKIYFGGTVAVRGAGEDPADGLEDERTSHLAHLVDSVSKKRALQE